MKPARPQVFPSPFLREGEATVLDMPKADATPRSPQIKGLLKGELKRRNVSYEALSEALKAMGVDELAENIANKISRGRFTAVFLLQCLEAVGCKTLRLDDA